MHAMIVAQPNWKSLVQVNQVETSEIRLIQLYELVGRDLPVVPNRVSKTSINTNSIRTPW